MRRLQPNEKCKTGDWFYLFHVDKAEGKWIQLSDAPMALKRKTLAQNDQENEAVHFPLVVMRPTLKERALNIKPDPPEFTREEKAHIQSVKDFYND